MPFEMTDFFLPPVVQNAEGKTRTVGFEIEFAGMTVTRAAELVAHCMNGEIEQESRFLARVTGTAHGTFRIEADAKVLKEDRRLDELPAFVGDVVEEVAGAFVPLEIVTPPIPIDELRVLEALEADLRENNAMGTNAAWRYAFGLHINPEVPDSSARSIWAHLRAFLRLYPSILKLSNIDLMRRVTPFIDPFPDPYVEHIVEAISPPDRSTLVRDYLGFNPTRNRPLDLLPLFKEFEPELLAELLPDDEGVNKRPTYHYRLPNCEIDNPSWSIAREWNRWVEIETLALAYSTRHE